MNLLDFNYDLPESLIGQKVIYPRDSCKLMVIDKTSKNISTHIFSDLVDILDKNTVLVINDTKVFPARLLGIKDSGGKTEILLLKQIALNTFVAIGKGRLPEGQIIHFSPDFHGEIKSNRDGEIKIQFNVEGTDLIEKIDKIGKTPLPPYIHSKENEPNLRTQYQTVYAKKKGSAAAPTAGLHFTNSLLKKLKQKGVQIERITLHVGLGTFKPVSPEQIATKTLHSEEYSVSEEVATNLSKAKQEGKKIIAVGTTSCRLLETLATENSITKSKGETNIFIQPGYKFKFVDGLITNFHLPSTSLLMLVSAFMLFPNTKEKLGVFKNSTLGKAYLKAVKEKYHFFSFGDAMYIK